MSKKIFILLIYFYHQIGFSQVILDGIIRDSNTKDVIPYSNVYLVSGRISTMSNENGEFSLTIDKFPVKLVISNIAYLKDTVEVLNSIRLAISLKPAIRNLQEVVISNIGYKLIDNALVKIENNKKNISYANGFYRQLIFNGAINTQYQEVFYALKLSAKKIEGIKINHARFAKIPSNDENLFTGFYNFSYLVLAQAVSFVEIPPSPNSILFPLRKDVLNHYVVSVQGFIEDIEGSVAILYCKPTVNKEFPAFEGEIYINTTTHDIIKIVGKIPHALGAEINSEKIKTSNFVYQFDILLKKNKENHVFDNIIAEVTFDEYMKPTQESRKVRVKGTLFIYESIEKSNIKYKDININTNDLKEIQKIKYNSEFWKSNPIVKRTPLEESIIQFFEKKGVFSNMKIEDLK